MSQEIIQNVQNGVRSHRPPVSPSVDVYEQEDGLLLIADLPGVTKDQLEIRIHNDELVLEANRPGMDEENELMTEFRSTHFRRTFTIHEKLDVDNVTAELKNGVLYVTLPKAPDLKPRHIAINA